MSATETSPPESSGTAAHGDAARDEHVVEQRGADTWPGRVAFWFGAALSVLHIWFNTFGTLSELWTSVIHFAGFGLLCALLFPGWRARTAAGARVVLAVDVLLGLAALGVAFYLILGEGAFHARSQRFLVVDWVFTWIAVLLAIEFTRRTTGLVIPILIVVAFTYVTWWGRMVPGVLSFPGLSVETVLFRVVYVDDGMFGTIANISSTFVFMFILFGAFLLRSGAGAFIIDFARAVARHMIGGPGFVAVLGSAMMGTISGSSVANTVSTGVITIPLMKRAGYSGRFAAGTEAAASTGGQLMPPIMGAGAFVMASYTQISYLTIAAVSILPALLYFLSVLYYVRIRAKKLNLVALDDDAPAMMDVLRRGGLVFFVPIGVLIALLMRGYTPTYAAGYAIISVVVASWLTRNPMGPRAVLEALALGARNMVMTAVLLVAVGIVVMAVATTGVGNTFSLMINQWAGNSLLIAMVLIALASLVLGMGLPVTAAYIVLATLSAPALADLITRNELISAFADGRIPDTAKAILMLVAPDRIAELGRPMSAEAAEALIALIPLEMMPTVVEQTLSPQAKMAALLSAHMIIFWLSQDSNVTPPVCLTAFAAAAIAKSPPMATGFVAWRLAKGLYVVPILFAYTPFLGLDYWVDLEIALFAAVGLYCFAAAFEGHMESPVNWLGRVVLLGLCLALIWPNDRLVHAVALALFAALFAFDLWRDRRLRRAPAPA